ncbi:MAG: hypothetical protein Tsb009_18100 [Planctomycetaceae bacterium]
MTTETLKRILDETWIRSAEFHPTIDSTNTRAIQRLADADLPLLIWADAQSAGRGRGNHRWWSAEGSLTFSVVIDEISTGHCVGRDPRTALIAGLAVAETLKAIASDQTVQLKWPNDVWLNGRKICGILVEVPPVHQDAAVIGVGLNVNNSLASLPKDIRQAATSLIDSTSRMFDREELLITFLGQLKSHILLLKGRDDSFANAWNSFCGLTGRTICVENGDRIQRGQCLGIDGSGALILQQGTGISQIISGTIHLDNQ